MSGRMRGRMHAPRQNSPPTEPPPPREKWVFGMTQIDFSRGGGGRGRNWGGRGQAAAEPTLGNEAREGLLAREREAHESVFVGLGCGEPTGELSRHGGQRAERAEITARAQCGGA